MSFNFYILKDTEVLVDFFLFLNTNVKYFWLLKMSEIFIEIIYMDVLVIVYQNQALNWYLYDFKNQIRHKKKYFSFIDK